MAITNDNPGIGVFPDDIWAKVSPALYGRINDNQRHSSRACPSKGDAGIQSQGGELVAFLDLPERFTNYQITG